MSIYIVTENNFFFIGIKEQLPFNKSTIKKLPPSEFNNKSMNEFYNDDVFIFHTTNFSIEISFLLSTGGLPGKLIFIPTTSKERFRFAFNRYVVLDTYAKVNDISNEITNNNEIENLKYNIIKEPLTKQESIVMHHTINGLDASKISQRLSISTKTVYTHRRNAFHKLGGRNLLEIWHFRGKFLHTEMA